MEDIYQGLCLQLLVTFLARPPPPHTHTQMGRAMRCWLMHNFREDTRKGQMEFSQLFYGAICLEYVLNSISMAHNEIWEPITIPIIMYVSQLDWRSVLQQRLHTCWTKSNTSLQAQSLWSISETTTLFQ